MINKKIVIICTIIALVIVTSIVGFNIKKLNDNDLESLNELGYEQNQVSKKENEINSNLEKEESLTNNETKEEQEDNETNNNVDEDTNTQIQGQEETKNDDQKNNEDNTQVAIELVKQEWGVEDDTVYYTVDNKKDDAYVISVRSKLTTETLAEYEVNVNDKTVVIQ